MSQLNNLPITVGDVRRFVLDYNEWLPRGDTITACTITSSSTTTTVGSVTVLQGNYVSLMVTGGLLNEVVTLSIQATTNRGAVKNDTLSLFVVSP